MASKDLVKGYCKESKCEYDVYTKEKVDEIIGDEYKSTNTYNVGDLVIYNNSLYECNTAITTVEEWNVEHWTLVTISKVLKDGGTVLWRGATWVEEQQGWLIPSTQDFETITLSEPHTNFKKLVVETTVGSFVVRKCFGIMCGSMTKIDRVFVNGFLLEDLYLTTDGIYGLSILKYFFSFKTEKESQLISQLHESVPITVKYEPYKDETGTVRIKNEPIIILNIVGYKSE